MGVHSAWHIIGVQIIEVIISFVCYFSWFRELSQFKKYSFKVGNKTLALKTSLQDFQEIPSYI